MPSQKLRRVGGGTGWLLVALCIAGAGLRLTAWASNNSRGLNIFIMVTGFAAVACFLFWFFTKDNPEREIPQVVGKKTQKARDVGQMFQADHIHYSESPSVNGSSLNIDVEIKEITFNATRTGGQSVFLWVKLFLRSPNKVAVTYSLSLVSHGVPSHPTLINDLDSWMFRERDNIGEYKSSGPYLPAISMPSVIEAGIYVEGWLHFVSDEVTHLEVGKSVVRLRLDTACGKIEKERQGITITGTRYTMRRRIDLET